MRRTIFEDEHMAFRESVRRFLMNEAVPHREDWERDGMVDRGYWRKAAAHGFVAFSASELYGGAGLDDFRFNAIIDEEVAYTGAVGDNFTLVNDIITPYLTELANEEQQGRWLPGIASGALVPAIAMTEPGAGSDLRGIAASARWRGDHYALTGSKTFVTSGIQADLVIVAARVVRKEIDGLGLFVVENGMPGFERGRKLAKLGRHAQDTAELFFDEVQVPPENVIGEPGRGLQLLMRNLPQERLSMAVTAVASAERGLQLTMAYVRDRQAFGQSIGKFQANRFLLADLTTELQVARTYVDRCLVAHLEGELSAEDAAGAKLWTTELQLRVLDRCLQLHGGYGYMEEYEIGRMWRDARVQTIYGGTSEIMREIVGRSLGL